MKSNLFYSGWAESGKILRLFIREAKKRGIQFIIGKVTSLISKEGNLPNSKSRVSGVRLEDGKSIYADETIVACGAWTPVLLPWIKKFITPVAQPLILFEPKLSVAKQYVPKNGFPVIATALEATGFYVFPYNEKEQYFKVGNHGTGIPLSNYSSITPELIQSLQDQTRHQEEEKFRKFLSEYNSYFFED